jgi:hypothetical protein
VKLSKNISPHYFGYTLLILVLVFSIGRIVFGTAPIPGHNFSEIGGGVVQGDILYGSAADTISALAKNTSATRYLSNTGTTNNPAWAQVDLTTGITGALGLANGGTGQITAAAARGSSGLDIDQMTNVGDANYTILNTDRTVQTNAAFTAPRTWTLPAASTLNAGQSLCIYDKQGTLTTTNTLTISRAGSDTINGATSITRNTAFMGMCLNSDGSSKWTMPIEGEASGGTGQNSYTVGDMLYSNSTNNLAKLADVAAGSYLRSGGVGAAPVWSTPTLPNTAATGKVMVGNGTNWVESTPTFPNASATLRKIIVSDGTNWIASTETYATPGTAGNILYSDGTNWTSTAIGLVAAAKTANTTVANTVTDTTGGVTYSAPAIGAGQVYRITARGTFTAANSVTARNAQIKAYWGSTALTPSLIKAVLASTAQTTNWEAEFELVGTSTTAIWTTGAFDNQVNSATIETRLNATPASTTVTSGAQTLDLRFSMSASVAGDSWSVQQVLIERLK